MAPGRSSLYLLRVFARVPECTVYARSAAFAADQGVERLAGFCVFGLLLAALAFEHVPQVRRAAFRGSHPLAIHPRRIVPHVLSVPAVELRNPIAEFVEVKAGDFVLCHKITIA